MIGATPQLATAVWARLDHAQLGARPQVQVVLQGGVQEQGQADDECAGEHLVHINNMKDPRPLKDKKALP